MTTMKSKKSNSNSRGKRNNNSKSSKQKKETKTDDIAWKHSREAMTPRQLLHKALIRIVFPLVLAFGINWYQNYQMEDEKKSTDNDDSIPKNNVPSSSQQQEEWKRYFTEDWTIAPKKAAAESSSTDQTMITHVETFSNGATCQEESEWEEVNSQLFEGRPYRWYNELGQVVPTMEYLSVNATRLYKGPEKAGTHFVWPCKNTPRPVPGLSSNVRITTLSSHPRIYHVSNFLKEEEMEELKEYAMSEENPYRMSRSTAGTHKSWEQRESEDNVLSTRTSENAFDVSTINSLNIRQRAFQLLRLPSYVENMADGIQILRYKPGQAYIAHHDYFNENQSADHNWNPQNGGSNRWATVFLYLSDVTVGGQTIFPYATASEQQSKDYPNRVQLYQYLENLGISPTSWEGEMVLDKCFSNKNLSVQPKKGDALLFYSQLPNGSLDPVSLHGACPVLGLQDQKWGANLWVWNACRYSLCENDPLQPTDELPPSLKPPSFGQS